jgi:hypothetical protein
VKKEKKEEEEEEKTFKLIYMCCQTDPHKNVLS